MSTTTVGATPYVDLFGGTLAALDGSGRVVEIGAEPLTVGRADQCGLVIPDKKVSTLHAELTATPSGVHLRDLASRNGILVDQHRVLEGYLRGPAKIKFGDTIFQYTPGAPVRVAMDPSDSFGPIVGNTKGMKQLFDMLRKVAASDFDTLIAGETGTGKELVAHAIHAASRRAQKPFVIIDCGAITASLAESTLFGHEKGAFTGAVGQRISPFVLAEGGTVFLDEIGELPLDLQPKLLRVIQERKIQSVGGRSYQPVNVRILSATRRNLAKEINNGGFRSDLYFRLAHVCVTVPPLRDRTEDIPRLVQRFAQEIGAETSLHRIPKASMEKLARHDWVGNVRQLRNVVTASLAFADPQGPIEFDAHLSGAHGTGGAEPDEPIDALLISTENQYWRDLFASCAGSIPKMVKISGRSRTNIRNKLEQLGLRSVGGIEDR